MSSKGVQLFVTVAPSFENLSKAFRHLNVNKSVNEYIKQYAILTERYSKQVTPVDTGRLRSSINTLLYPTRQMAVVGTNVEYARFVHEGTRKMRGRPFMKFGQEYAGRRLTDDNLADRISKDIRQQFTKL